MMCSTAADSFRILERVLGITGTVDENGTAGLCIKTKAFVNGGSRVIPIEVAAIFHGDVSRLGMQIRRVMSASLLIHLHIIKDDVPAGSIDGDGISSRDALDCNIFETDISHPGIGRRADQ